MSERGRLRIHLGAAAGVGTTYAMLQEAIRRRERGTRVAIGCIDTRGRERTAVLVQRLRDELSVPVPNQPDVLDLEQLIEAAPDVVLVDDLAVRGPDARPHWHGVDVLLDAGIDVISTLTVQHVESLADSVRAIVGHAPTSTVPDDFLSRAEQIELVDVTPEAIRRRIAHGNVFIDDVHPLDTDLYTSTAFAELRALMLFWMADRLSAGPADPRGAGEIVVVALTDAPTSDQVLRRAARLAHRSRARLVAVHVSAGRVDPEARRRERRERVEAVGGVLHELVSDEPGAAIASFAESEGATQIVIGSGRPGRSPRATVLDTVLQTASRIDVHVVPTHDAPAHRPPHWNRLLSVRRQLVAGAVGLATLVVLTVVLVGARGDVSITTSLALYLLLVVGISAVGGAIPGLVAAVASPLVANWFLIPPYHTFRVSDRDNLIELFVFVSVAAIVSFFVSVSARRATEAARARREASTLASLTGSGELDHPVLLVERIVDTFGFDGVAVLSTDDGRAWRPTATSGDAPSTPDDADVVSPLSVGTVLAARGEPLDPDDHRILRAFTAQLARAFEQQRLREVAAEADALARADELRTAMLRAVSHDLRSPLASIKASVSSIRQPDIDWPDDVRDDFLESIESETDRLTAIITNLLDLSRIEAGVLRPAMRLVSVDDVVSAALRGLTGGGAVSLRVDVAADLPEAVTDPALLERVVANLAANALRFSPPGREVLVSARVEAGSLRVHVVDHGPGIPPDQRAVVVQPFHRLDDSATGGGLGLGLAIVDRLVAALGGRLDLHDTPGGGLTAVVTLATGVTS